jgi:hypothetical protein
MTNKLIEDANRAFADIPLGNAEAERATAKSWWILAQMHADKAEFWKAEYEKLKAAHDALLGPGLPEWHKEGE